MVEDANEAPELEKEQRHRRRWHLHGRRINGCWLGSNRNKGRKERRVEVRRRRGRWRSIRVGKDGFVKDDMARYDDFAGGKIETAITTMIDGIT